MASADPRFRCYAITDQASALGREDEEVALGLLRGGSSCLQYRAKKVPAKVQWRVAPILRDLCAQHGALFIVNDRVDLALACGADGLHLGQDDMPPAAARDLARRAGRGDLIVGVSTHSLGQALAAQAAGADYIGYGPVFETRTKENNVPAVGLDSLAQVAAAVDIPLVAIGGIKLDRIESIARAGARACAIVTALTGAADVEAETRRHWAAWDAALAGAGRAGAGAAP